METQNGSGDYRFCGLNDAHRMTQLLRPLPCLNAQLLQTLACFPYVQTSRNNALIVVTTARVLAVTFAGMEQHTDGLKVVLLCLLDLGHATLPIRTFVLLFLIVAGHC